jgi:hypothetical protein
LGVFAAPAAVTLVIVAGLAAAKMSAGAPCTIWVASVALDPKLKVTLLPGFLASKSLPIWLNASVREAAASTVMAPPLEEPAGLEEDGAVG